MFRTVYLLVMVGIVVLVTLLSVPWLFRRPCAKCGAWNRLEASRCKRCSAVFPLDYE